MVSSVKTGWEGNDLHDGNPTKALQGITERLAIRQQGAEDFIILDGVRLIPPAPARAQHASHSGSSKMYATARQLYYWPGMKQDIASLNGSCPQCSLYQKSNTKSQLRLTPPSEAKLPMHNMATDLFEAIGKQWIVLVDKYSGYCFIQDPRIHPPPPHPMVQ